MGRKNPVIPDRVAALKFEMNCSLYESAAPDHNQEISF